MLTKLKIWWKNGVPKYFSIYKYEAFLTIALWDYSTPFPSIATDSNRAGIRQSVADIAAVCCCGEIVKWSIDVAEVCDDAISWIRQHRAEHICGT